MLKMSFLAPPSGRPNIWGSCMFRCHVWPLLLVDPIYGAADATVAPEFCQDRDPSPAFLRVSSFKRNKYVPFLLWGCRSLLVEVQQPTPKLGPPPVNTSTSKWGVAILQLTGWRQQLLILQDQHAVPTAAHTAASRCTLSTCAVQPDKNSARSRLPCRSTEWHTTTSKLYTQLCTTLNMQC